MTRAKNISRLKMTLAGLFLLIFSAYYVSSTMFYHQHTINGDKISHSHFFSKVHANPSESGGHSVEVVKLIAALNHFSVEQQNFDSHLGAIERRLESVSEVADTACAKFFLEPCRSLRAPPQA